MPTQIGPYTLISRIAQGGMATVYLARHGQTGETVALKMLSPRVSEDDEYIARFRREGQVIASLNHPNIVPVYETGCDQGQLYIAMGYLNYGTLKERIAKYAALGETMPIDEVLDAARQIAWALDHAHNKGLIHRDVKPSNILLAAGGRFVLSDFGLALVQGSTRLTRTQGHLVGTPEYMSPEQANQQPFDQRSDLYALGVVMYEMLTGRTPFLGEVEMVILYGHVHAQPPPMQQARPDIPAALIQLVDRAMAKSPEARFQTAGEMALAIEALSQPASEHKPLQLSRRPLVALIAGLICVVSLAIILGVVAASTKRSAPPMHTQPSVQLAQVWFVSHADPLSVRSQPNTTAPILAQITPQETCLVIAKTADQHWLLIVVDTRVGWVLAADGQITGSLKAVPNAALPSQQISENP